MIPKAFIISLERVPERRAKAVSECEKAGLEYEIVDAVDAQDYKLGEDTTDWERLTREFPWNNRSWGTPLRAVDIAIVASHIKAYRRILQDGIPGAFIFEDDWCLSGRSCYGIKETMEALHDTPGWTHCTLHHDLLSYNPAYRITGRPHHLLWQVNECPLIGVAYAASRRFCDLFLRAHPPITAPHDHLMCYLSRRKDLTFLQTVEPVCGSSGAPTTNL